MEVAMRHLSVFAAKRCELQGVYLMNTYYVHANGLCASSKQINQTHLVLAFRELSI